MPLMALSDVEAVSNRKRNPVAGWGNRSRSNRVEPVALPHFDVPFKFKPGERIFTIGSCFARNVEGELFKRGFVLPVWDLFKLPAFRDLSMGIINNYGTPSIYNEIAWAFGERPFLPEEHLLEVRNGKFADIHLASTLRPEPREIVLERREAISQAYRTAVECTVVIVTLGLAEVWFDRQTGYYLNVTPRPSLIDRHPGRFELHVLSFQEALEYLESAIFILRKHAPSIRILLTVSPVPLASTHRPIDVMVANTYSKSLLRTVAEIVASTHELVAYYPSYESVTLSDRKMAWMDDMVHPTQEMVALNVARMIEAFVESAETDVISDPLSAVDKARAAQARGPEFADVFFEKNREWSESSVEFAMEHARHLLSRKRAQEAYDVLSRHDPSKVNLAILVAQALIALERGREALDLLEPLAQRTVKSVYFWAALLAAAMLVDDEDKVNSILWEFNSAVTGRIGAYYLKAAKWFLARGSGDRALILAKAAIEEPLVIGTVLELTDFLIELGELSLAARAVELASNPNRFERARVDKLRAFLGC